MMDAFAFHPYQDNSSQPPTFQHPKTTTIALADYGKLAACSRRRSTAPRSPARRCRSSTASSASRRRSRRPRRRSTAGPSRRRPSPSTRRPRPSTTAHAIAIAFCQPNVQALFVFHAVDEPALDRWQSGVYYADGTAKSSLTAVAGGAARRARRRDREVRRAGADAAVRSPRRGRGARQKRRAEAVSPRLRHRLHLLTRGSSACRGLDDARRAARQGAPSGADDGASGPRACSPGDATASPSAARRRSTSARPARREQAAHGDARAGKAR